MEYYTSLLFQQRTPDANDSLICFRSLPEGQKRLFEWLTYGTIRLG